MRKIVCTVILMVMSFSIVQAQTEKEKKEKIYLKVKDGKKPVVYVDGKKFDFPIELIDQTQIESMMVLKKQDAIKKYNAPNGVILIKTKGSPKFDYSKIEVTKDGKLIGVKNAPLVIIDGKISDRKSLDKLSPKTIKKMEIVKGEKAIKKYNAPNGVIIITTKKK